MCLARFRPLGPPRGPHGNRAKHMCFYTFDPLGPHFLSSWAPFLSTFGGTSILGPFWEPFGRPLGALWEPLGTLWGPLGTLWEAFGALWEALGTLGNPLGDLWGPLGTLWEALGAFGEPFGTFWERLEALRGNFGFLGVPFGAFLASLRCILGSFSFCRCFLNRIFRDRSVRRSPGQIERGRRRTEDTQTSDRRKPSV